MKILPANEEELSSQQVWQLISKFFQFWAVSIDLGTLPSFHTVLREKVVIFFTLPFPTDPTTSELTRPLVQMEVGFQAWCFTQKSFGTLLWPGIHSSVTEDKTFAIKKKKDKKSSFLWRSALYLRSFSSRTWLTLLSIQIKFGHCFGFLAMHKKFSHYFL